MAEAPTPAGRVEVNILARIHAGHVHIARPIHCHARAIVIAFPAPRFRPLQVTVQIELAEEGVKENRASGGGMIGMPIMASPRIKVSLVTRKISGYIEIYLPRSQLAFCQN